MITLVNGNPQNLSGLIVPNGSITFQLNTDATVIASPFGLVAAGLEVVFQFNEIGEIQPNPPAVAAQIYSNAELNPRNAVGLATYYLVTFYNANGERINKSPMWWQFPNAANTTVDISTMTAYFTEGNVIFYPIGFGAGTVTSVSFTGEGVVFSPTPGTPVITAGTLTPTLLNQAPNTVFAGPASGGPFFPSFRPLVASDVPGLGPGGNAADVQTNNGDGTFHGDDGFQYDGAGTVSIVGSLLVDGVVDIAGQASIQVPNATTTALQISSDSTSDTSTVSLVDISNNATVATSPTGVLSVRGVGTAISFGSGGGTALVTAVVDTNGESAYSIFAGNASDPGAGVVIGSLLNGGHSTPFVQWASNVGSSHGGSTMSMFMGIDDIAANCGIDVVTPADFEITTHSAGNIILSPETGAGGRVTAPTLTAGDNSTAVATTAYADANAGIKVVMTITSAELDALGGTPLTMLAAPGAGLAAIITKMTLQYKFGTTPYVVGNADNNLVVAYGSNPTTAVAAEFETVGFLDATQSQFTYINGLGSFSPSASLGFINTVDAANQPLVVSLQGTTPGLSSGDGTLVITFWYTVVPAVA